MRARKKTKLKPNKPVVPTIGLFMSFAMGSTYAQLDNGLNNGLLSYWDFENNFEDTAGDFSDSANTFDDDGTGGTGVVFATEGLFGTFGDFERSSTGTDNLVTVPDSADLDASGESLSVSVWFRVDAFNQNWQSIIVHGENDDWRLARRAGEQGLSYAGGLGDVPANTTPNVNDGEWHHAVGITEAGVSTRLWIDGQLIATNTGTATITNDGSPQLFIGGNPLADTTATGADQFRPWDGGIDELALWNRPLTNAEIQEIFTSGQQGVSIRTLLDPTDTDGDGLPDVWENLNGLDPNDDGSIDVNNGAAGDPDLDNLNNLAEFSANTDPQDPDSDDDDANDFVEVNTTGTDPLDPDSDDDTLLDGHETNTGIFVSTTDTGTDPEVSDIGLDSDEDTLLNIWEIDNSLDPFDATGDNGEEGDPDMDNSVNFEEQSSGSDPQDPDTDDDFLLDGEELDADTDPLDPDSDGDNLLDGHETNTGIFVSATDTGTDPNELDTDGDSFNDDTEIMLGSDPNDPADIPTFSTLPIIDDFEDNSLDPMTWTALIGQTPQSRDFNNTGGDVVEAEGCVQLTSRGYLHTIGQFNPEDEVGGIGILGEVTFQPGADIFSILTRATPNPLTDFGEATSGIRFNIDDRFGTIGIAARNGDHSISEPVITGAIDVEIGTVYIFQVIDREDGSLFFSVSERDNPANIATAIAELLTDTSDTDHILFYNREGGRMSALHEVSIVADPEVFVPAIETELIISDISVDPAAGENGTVTLTWSSQAAQTYAINASTDLMSFDIEVATGITGEAESTTQIFDNPMPGAERLFFQVSEEEAVVE